MEQLNWSLWLRSEALNVCVFVWTWSRFSWKQQVSGLDLPCMSEVTKKIKVKHTEAVHGSRILPSISTWIRSLPLLPTAMFPYNTSAGCHNSRPSSLYMCVWYAGRFGWYVNACHWWFEGAQPQFPFAWERNITPQPADSLNWSYQVCTVGSVGQPSPEVRLVFQLCVNLW